jgi:Flp pilus assembly protein TadG
MADLVKANGRSMRSRWAASGRRCAGTEATQVVELAVSLPLLLVIAIGITDFGTALNLKHQLIIAVREGARLASNQSTADLTNPAPASVDAVRQAVDGSLVGAKINDCGLSAAVAAQAATGLVWIYTASGCPAGTLTLTIDRGSTFLTTGSPPVTVEATHVSISYPFQWRFNGLITLLVPGARYSAVSQITTDVTMQNLN